MATVYEIIQGLSQAAANAYDGALDDKGEPLKAGLQREEGDPILDKRVMDGFGVKFYGNMMCLSYMSEVQLKEVYASGFESDVEQRIADIVSFLKKEYRKVTGESVTLTKEGDVDVLVQNSSRVRTWVNAKCHYRVGGLNEENQVSAEQDTKPEASWETFLSQGGWDGTGGKRPQNDTRKKES
tara:strand:+ start:875 stop:1423 length:549 start_codon:yes stop_codon:yes gene_type:complete